MRACEPEIPKISHPCPHKMEVMTLNGVLGSRFPPIFCQMVKTAKVEGKNESKLDEWYTFRKNLELGATLLYQYHSYIWSSHAKYYTFCIQLFINNTLFVIGILFITSSARIVLLTIGDIEPFYSRRF